MVPRSGYLSIFQFLGSARENKFGSKVLWKWGVKQIENQWKRGSIGSQIKGKLVQNALNLLHNTFWWNIRPNVGPSISGTKCDRGKPIFSAEREDQSDCVEGVITAEPHYHVQVWEYPPQLYAAKAAYNC